MSSEKWFIAAFVTVLVSAAGIGWSHRNSRVSQPRSFASTESTLDATSDRELVGQESTPASRAIVAMKSLLT